MGMGVCVFCGDEKYSKLTLRGWLHSSVIMLKSIELYTFSG